MGRVFGGEGEWGGAFFSGAAVEEGEEEEES